MVDDKRGSGRTALAATSFVLQSRPLSDSEFDERFNELVAAADVTITAMLGHGFGATVVLQDGSLDALVRIFALTATIMLGGLHVTEKAEDVLIKYPTAKKYSYLGTLLTLAI